MNKAILSMLFLGTVSVFSCKDKDPEVFPPARGGEVNIEVVHHVEGKAVNYGYISHVTASGDSFQVDLINHFVSNFSFHIKGGSWTEPKGYRLVRHSDSSSRFFTIKDLPFSEYDSVRFYIGLDTHANHSLEMASVLDPGAGMIWTWNTGYIFYMFEGKFINKNGVKLGFAYHMGGDDYLMEYSLPIQKAFQLSSDRQSENLKIRVNLGEIFKTPYSMDLDSIPLVTHTMDHPDLVKDLTENLLDAAETE